MTSHHYTTSVQHLRSTASSLNSELSFAFHSPPSTSTSTYTVLPTLLSKHIQRRSNPNSNQEQVDSSATTIKLTHKFPIHRSVKSLSRGGGGGNGSGRNRVEHGALGGLLNESQGLGVDLKVGKWTGHKWFLFISIWTIFICGLGGLVCAILTWFRTWEYADVMYVADYDVLVLITMSSSLLLLTFLVGITGTILNSRPILAVYALLLWPCLISILAIGYTSYKRYTFALDRKLNLAWSQWYTPTGRLTIQDSLHCCGFYSPLHEVTPSKHCYVRTLLPGCKSKLYALERQNLGTIWTIAFAIVPLHIANIFVALLCVNHVTRTFGKGIMPKQYRLTVADVRANAEKLFGPPMLRSRDRTQEDSDHSMKFRPSTANYPGVVVLPQMSVLSSGSILREDREERRPFMEGWL
ncbi:hypothetical protein C8Q75DRAFT_725855 [Abortiporus biennis]|nr:hypothetical protein C8Q75DRAFT_725855 [Abortiporus biennis]